MKIKHFLYNAFLIENDTSKIAIDPGQNLWIFNLSSLIPQSEWGDIRHILITHGDPDHHWQSDKVPFIWKKNMAPADGHLFKQEVEKLGIQCSIMQYGGEIEI